ncbi:MAG: YqgE/AlgH family protein [Leadbetterella sp.]
MTSNPGKRSKSIQPGSILVADPFMGDPYFEKSVVLICEHNHQGTFGLMYNRYYGKKVSQIIDLSCDARVCIGGPVQNNTLHFIHRRPDLISDSIFLGNDIYWSGDYENLKKSASIGILDENDIRFFIGYTGWGKGQLERELSDKAWVISHTNMDEILTEDFHLLWKNGLSNAGLGYKILADIPTDFSLN